MQQAQKELTKLTAEAPPPLSTAPEPSASATEQAASLPAEAVDAASSSSSSTASISSETTDKAAPESPASQPAQPQTIFARLQASLPPALANVQSQIPESLKETLKHGIGYYHEALDKQDKRIMERLFQHGAIQVLIASKVRLLAGLKWTDHR